MKNYTITIDGSDDCTEFEIELSDEEYNLLGKVSELSEKHATRICQPKLFIQEGR